MPGSHQPQWIDALHRAHAGVEDQVRHAKTMGLRNLPSKAWTVNQGWVLAANIAADLTAWMRLLGLHDQKDLSHAEPDTLRYRLLHLPAKLTTHARRRILSISETWPWADAFTLCWQRLTRLPAT
ncbi:transposase [Pseudosporangium ferrugineum]|uniref:transposase n=1 Tax=Pseudosporangium ferrugineum TaxID=439699 RepID=UPI0024820868|nr:transposase [Pseudosporangium ferrugineum]